MKNLFLTLALWLTICQVQAQTKVSFSGQIKNTNPEESIYLGLDGLLLPLKVMEGGTFEVEGSVEQNPSFFYITKISKRGEIENQTPRIWFEAESIKVNFDWSNKSLQTDGLMPFQSISEHIESLNGTEQFEFLQKNPNEIPSLYFADLGKEKFKIADLEEYVNSLNEENKKSINAKRIGNYLSAMKRPSLEKGNYVENFKLPNENNEYVTVINSKNKPQIIALLSSGCAYSIASINFLKQLSELNEGEIEIVTIWDDKSKSTWLNSHRDEKSKITWTDLWDEFEFAKTYLNGKMWPTFYVINEDGELGQILKGYDKKTAKELKKLVE